MRRRIREKLKPRKLIRIYTEGKMTEPQYFEAIKDEIRPSAFNVKIQGVGKHTDSLVNYVKKLKEQSESTDEETEWWVVFDHDDHQNFEKAIRIAEAADIKVAYSNECFEIWYLLHFQYFDTAFGRKDCFKKLSEKLGQPYQKTDNKIYSAIRLQEKSAIRNAKKLEKEHTKNGVISAINRNPSTTVYRLVERLRGEVK